MNVRLQHTIDFAGESTPTWRAKPAGVLGAEIWFKADGPPVDPGELEFLAVDPVTRTASRAGTRAPYTRDYAGAQGGKPAHYMQRWVNSKGETGPPVLDEPQRTKFAAAQRPLAACQGWSETATATIGA